MNMIEGQCLCGCVSWEVEGELADMTHCHCSMCRKAHGAPFATYAFCSSSNFHMTTGADCVSTYRSSPGSDRYFCKCCGSVVPGELTEGRIEIPVGLIDGDPEIRAHAHIFATSRAPWYTITDDLPQYEHYEAPEVGPIIDMEPRSAGRDGVLRGSCLCDEIAFEVTRPMDAVHHCHCLRCRRARASAHTTNGLTAVDNFRFTRGEELLKTYRLETARYFSQVFCTQCGSGMPRVDSERNLVVIPFGSLDDDPGQGAQDNIYVGSMAPWYEITDNLPQFEEAPD